MFYETIATFFVLMALFGQIFGIAVVEVQNIILAGLVAAILHVAEIIKKRK